MDLKTLKSSFSGETILPKDSRYQQAKDTLFFKGAPAIVLRPKTADDVALAIKYALANGLDLSVRSGGHSIAGFSTNQGGVVIDLSLIHDIELIDSDKHIVRLGTGAKWGDVGKALQNHGLALSSGDTVSVGVGGLTLGAGVGWMVRKYGLAIDSLVAAQVVTADGRILHVNETEHPDLFWAIRGGGGNFGIVTHFEFVAHPIGNVMAGSITYGLDELPQVLTGWRDYMRTAPEELTTILLAIPSFMGMPPSAIIMCCFAGDNHAEADKALAPLRKLGKIVSDNVKEKHYYEVLEEAHVPEGVEIINKNGFVPNLSDELIQVIVGLYHDDSGPVLQIRSLGGAMKRVAPDATAFAHRSSEALIVSPYFVPIGASRAEKTTATAPWRQIEPLPKVHTSIF